MRLRVLIADDHRLILAALRRALTESGAVDVVGEARSGSQVVPLARRTAPDVVLVDVSMPDLDGIECARRLRAALPDLRIYMVTAYDAPEWIERARQAGADGYVLKSASPAELVELLTAAPDEPFPVVGRPASADDEINLSTRERAVLARLARGLTNKQIAQELWVTEQTVKFHLRNIYRKLGAENRTHAARLAHDRGVAAEPPLLTAG